MYIIFIVVPNTFKKQFREVISEVLNRNAKDNEISILDVAILLPTTADVFIKFDSF